MKRSAPSFDPIGRDGYVEALHCRYPGGPDELRRAGLDARAKVTDDYASEGPCDLKRLLRTLDDIGGLRVARWIRESTAGQIR